MATSAGTGAGQRAAVERGAAMSVDDDPQRLVAGRVGRMA